MVGNLIGKDVVLRIFEAFIKELDITIAKYNLESY